MPDHTHLRIYVSGSALCADFSKLKSWGPVLNSADAIALVVGDIEAIRVELSGERRWIAFNRMANGSPLCCIGYQETVGAIHRGGMIIGGSNRKTLAWLHPSGFVHIGEEHELCGSF